MSKPKKILDIVIKLRDEMKRSVTTYPTKFIGALTTELLRNELIKGGFNVSSRDVYISGLHNEFDLLILKKKQRARGNLLYHSDQVAAVLEVKFNGTFTKGDVSRVREVFASVKRLDKNILCLYLTVSENINFTYYRKEEKLGDHSFFLFHKTISDLDKAIEKDKIHETDDWDKVIEILKKQTCKTKNL